MSYGAHERLINGWNLVSYALVKRWFYNFDDDGWHVALLFKNGYQAVNVSEIYYGICRNVALH